MIRLVVPPARNVQNPSTERFRNEAPKPLCRSDECSLFGMAIENEETRASYRDQMRSRSAMGCLPIS
jgi:hypothetical protein